MSFRFDRFASLYIARPLRRIVSETGRRIPILMYHSISGEAEKGVHPYYRIATSPQRFAAQMKQLHASGYGTVSAAEAVSAAEESGACARKIVAITFDDGYRDFYHQAFPVLERFGFSATVYLPTAYIGDATAPFKGKECLTWAEVRELQQHGIRFGSHTVTHPQLHDLNPAQIQGEVVNSKKTIEEKIGCAVDSFAYPYAFPQTDQDFTRRLRDTLAEAGYENGVCTIVGRASRQSNPFFLERLPVNSCDDEVLFWAKLTGAYDWVGRFQHLLKRARGGRRVPAKYSVSKDLLYSSSKVSERTMHS
jgi:peptidoglycan/xylan/chitin deacetylase (PgdA/CDA1 family)